MSVVDGGRWVGVLGVMPAAVTRPDSFAEYTEASEASGTCGGTERTNTWSPETGSWQTPVTVSYRLADAAQALAQATGGHAAGAVVFTP